MRQEFDIIAGGRQLRQSGVAANVGPLAEPGTTEKAYRVANRLPIGFGEGGSNVDSERQTISIMKACEVVGVSRRTIYNWMAGGKVEYVRTAGGSVRIFADSLWRSPQGAPSGISVQH
jgi:excisionase family DNA binding protein